MKGDMNHQQNGSDYEFSGTDAKASIKDSTWTIKNITHTEHQVRKIYRFSLSDAPPFPAEQIPVKIKNLYSQEIKNFIFGSEKRKVGSRTQTPNEYDSFIFKGANEDVEKAIKYIERLYNDDKAHMTQLYLTKPLS